jgi:hypothetical protein
VFAPPRRPRHWLVAAALSAIALAALPACGGERASGLPSQLAVRSDVPYVRGTVTARRASGSAAVIRVRDEPGSEARVTDALVTVRAEAMLLWRDGRRAGIADLQVGRKVIVWTRGAELRSMPPQVAADAILLERR